MAPTGQNGARQNFNESGTGRAVVNKHMEKHLWQNRTCKFAQKIYLWLKSKHKELKAEVEKQKRQMNNLKTM